MVGTRLFQIGQAFRPDLAIKFSPRLAPGLDLDYRPGWVENNDPGKSEKPTTLVQVRFQAASCFGLIMVLSTESFDTVFRLVDPFALCLAKVARRQFRRVDYLVKLNAGCVVMPEAFQKQAIT